MRETVQLASHPRDAPAVSVIIPCYRQARFLGDAIESVQRQEGYRAAEVVVVDDGSPDDAAAVAARHPWVRYHRQPNRGVNAARNAGLRLTTGELVVFLDADDVLLPHALATNMRHHVEHAGLAFVSGQMQRVDVELRPIEGWRPRPHVQENHLRQLLVDNDRTYPCATMYRRAVIDDVGGWDEATHFATDWELNLRVARRAPIVLHDEVIALYRQHPESKMHNPAGMLRSVITLLRRELRSVRGDPALEAAARLGMHRVRAWYGEALFERARAHARERRLGALARDVALLLRYDPGRIALHARRKLALEARRALGRRAAAAREPVGREP
ncbi:MAG: glycosyltransferase [Gemmatimonadaceae bacterium]